MAISSAQNSRDKSFFLRKLAGFVPQFWMFYHTVSYFVCLSLHPSCSVAQFHLIPLLPLISSLTLSLYSLCPTQLQQAFSRFMLVLSRSNTQYLNRHTARCECHEILIERCITVLFLLNFSLYSIQIWLWWLSYSNHSFQLIHIQHSVQFYYPPRNHQSCFQEPFISTSNWRQVHIQRHIFVWHSNKASEFIAIDSAQNPLISEIESACCFGKIAQLSF